VQKEFAECFHEAAKEQRGKMIYVTVDTKDSGVGNVLRYFNIDADVDATVRVINMDGVHWVPTE
jgi:hypothetical protein